MQSKPGMDGAMKLCPGCKQCSIGERMIMQDYGRDITRADGRRVYCRKCMQLGRGRESREARLKLDLRN